MSLKPLLPQSSLKVPLEYSFCLLQGRLHCRKEKKGGRRGKGGRARGREGKILLLSLAISHIIRGNMPFWSVCLFNSIWLSAIPSLFLLTPRVNKIYSLCSGHTSSPEFDCLFVYFHFCVIPILMMARWNLNVVLICVSLMIKENEHFYISLLTTDSSIFVFRNVCSDDFSMFLCFFFPPSLSFSPPLSLSFFLNYYLLSVNIVHMYEHTCEYVWQPEFSIRMHSYVVIPQYLLRKSLTVLGAQVDMTNLSEYPRVTCLWTPVLNL